MGFGPQDTVYQALCWMLSKVPCTQTCYSPPDLIRKMRPREGTGFAQGHRARPRMRVAPILPPRAKPRFHLWKREYIIRSLVCNISSLALAVGTAMDPNNVPVGPKASKARFIIRTPRVSSRRKSRLLGLCPTSVYGTRFLLSSSCPTSCILEGPRADST